MTDSIKVDLKRNNSHLKKRRRNDNGNGERKWAKTVWRGINGVGGGHRQVFHIVLHKM